MKILHILQGFSLGGASRSVVAIAKDATQHKLDQVHCAISLTPAHPQAVKLAEMAGLQVIEAPSLETIYREITQADIVHIHFWNTPELYELLQLNLPPMRLLVWLKVVGDRSPHIVTSELVNYADILLATTPYSLEIPAIKSRSDLFTNNQIGVVPGIADFSRLESLNNRRHEGFNVGYIGTVDFSKLYQNYIPMSAGVQVPNIRFIVCGGGIENSLKQQAASLGVAEKFEFRGYVEDIKSVLEILDVFGYPLVEDTYATSEKSLQEAMYAGIPPVVFPHGGIKGLVINNQTGLVVNSEQEYQQAIAYLYHHPQERLRLGNNARNYAKQYFNPQVSIEKIHETYKQLMEFPKRERRLTTGNPQTGAALFVQSLGDIDPRFKVSLTSNHLSEQLESDRHISTASPGLCNPGGGGLFHYRNCYPQDGYLRFWSALVLQKQGRHQEAVNEFYQAWQNGCNIWRVLWYLANSAEQMGNHNLAQQAINRVLELIPNFTPAADMKHRINSLSIPATKSQFQPSKSLTSPKVSAIISTYNSANFLRGCLQDLVNQTLYDKQQLEIIVIDSNSQENEAEIVAYFQAKYTQIIYHRTEHRETLYAAWNRAIELAKGEYITNANTDDRHRFDALELMANYLDQHSDVAVVYGDQLITHNPNETFENTQANQRWNWPEFSYQELERRCCLGSQPMWRKSLHQKYGNFNPEFKVAGDYEFWLRIGKTENIAKIPEILGLYFHNDRGLENDDSTAQLELNKILNQYGITQRVIQRKTSIPVSYSHGLNSDEPLVSIIIPCYNQGQYLDEAIASVVAQTYSNWECWIINDGSQDQTSSVVKRWLEKYGDRQFNLIETPNRGVVSARNLGFAKSRGELILCVDADDKIHPEFIAEACQILSKYPQVGFVYSDIQHFGENHETVSHGDFDLRSFLQQNQAPVTSLFRAEIYRNIGGFKTVMEAGWEDWEFWISACEIGWLGYRLPKPYLFYRQHSSGSRLQTLSSDRTTLAIQKARIIQLHPKLYNVDAFIWSYNILSQLESVGNPVSPMKSPKFPSIPSVSNSINRPLWSIMIPTYNGDTYLEETLNSILEQDLDPQTTEIEVVDDCSTAGDTEAIVKTVGRGRVKFYRQPHNLGLVENWNACINRSRGHWVHILHQDDRVLPGFYRQIQQVFEAFPEVGAVFCRHYYIDNSGKFKLLSNLEQENPGILNNWLERIAVRQEIQFPSIVVRRSVYEHLGGFYPPVGYAADWEMWKRIASYYPVGYQPTPLACWRMHSLSASSRSIKQAKDMADMQHSIEISAEYLPPDKTAHLSRQAQENYSLYALQTARKFLESGQATEAIAQIKAGLKLSQSPQVRDGVIALFIESEVDAVQDTQKLAREVDLAVQKYQNNPQDSDGLNKLRSLRHHLAELWLKLETEQLPKAYQENLGQAHKSLLNSGIKNEIFRDDERLYFQEIKSYLSQGFKQPKTFQYLLAGMLYGRADQLMLTFEESLIPTWLAEDYFRFLFDVPPLFQEIGDADNYSRYRIRLLDFVRERLQQQPDYPLWQKLTTMLLERGNFIPNYFADFNLKPLFCSRAELFHLFLQSRDFQLDYSFPEPPSDRQKIRLGILNDHLNPQTETYLTLPAFEYLNREQFEIILYVTQANNHPLEQYCRSRADRLVRLPDDKLEQAATIRADNLDILLFGTNVTAITKPVTLLALHRLARVQATLFSSPVTTGMRYIDYYISGHLSEGAEAPNFYRENLAVLNGTGFCFNYYAIAPQPATVKPHRSQWGANDQTIVFMSGANFYKIIPEQGETWVKILAQVPNSILVLYPFAPSWSNNYASSQFIRRMHATLSKYGVAEKRLVLIKTLPSRTDVKACLEQGDIYLDSYPHSGSNSLVDPLEVGLPVVVRDGDTLRSKHGAAMMRSLGIPDLITDDESSYISLAVTLANTPELLQLKRQAIQQKMAANPEFLDSRAYGAKMGALLTQIFQNYQSKHQVIDLDNPQKQQRFLSELVDQVNLYELDPTNTMVVNKLHTIRRGMVEYWLRQPAEQLETLYQQQIGKGYQILLNRGLKKEPLNDEEKALVNHWTKTAMGLTEPHAINCLMAVMLYSQPGKMLVRDAVNRLPAWLLPDYQRVFENADAIAQIKQTLATTKTQSTPVNSPQVTPTVTAVDVSTFVNRLIGCVKLFKIDPTDTNITVELRQLRWQFAQFWLNLPEHKLEEMYQSPLGDGYRSLLNSRLQNEMLTQHEWDFLQQVGTYLRQGLDTPRSLNYLIAAMLYYRPEQLQIQDLSRLPSYLQRDYQNWQNPLSS
ncbi:glycosyltransferase [Limnospira platensis]|uniref:glycosyltransferase n=1 Tax=Limnospira platensis TaxID=118562 RepID=UPI0002804641|nr:glycosyl transferase family 2 [Arthrospira platensis C1]UWU46467.1 putative O-linked N-acetylglucosamine transferase, SPINDLY family [Arthrospira platensis C1]